MARKPPSLDALTQLAANLFGSSSQAIINGPPISCALLLTAMVENALMTMLHRFFIKSAITDGMFNINGELDSFMKCAKLAYCLGFFPDAVLTNLKFVAKIRNRFAHEATVLDFDDSVLSQWCKSFVYPKIDEVIQMLPAHLPGAVWSEIQSQIKAQGIELPSIEETNAELAKMPPRSQFMFISAVLCLQFAITSHLITRQKTNLLFWPLTDEEKKLASGEVSG